MTRARPGSTVLLAAVVVLAGCRTAGSNKVATSPPTPAPIRYSLPRTTLVVDVQVERANEAPGKYCDIVDLFLPELELVAACQTEDDLKPGQSPKPGQNMVAAKRRTTVQGYSVALKGSADPSRMHDVVFDSSWHVDRTDSMTFTEAGTLTGAEMQRADRTGEIVLGVLSNIAKIAGRFVFGGGTAVAFSGDEPWARIPVLKENFSLLKPARQTEYREYWKTQEGKARLVLATRSYESLGADLKTLDTVLGGIGAQGATTLVAELRKQIGERLADDFLGSKTKDTWTPSYEFTPTAPQSASQTFPLFTFAGCGVSTEVQQPMKNTLGVLRCANLNGAKPSELSFTVKTASNANPARLNHPDTPPSSNDVLYVIRPEAVVLNLDGNCRSDVTLVAPAKPEEKPTVSAQSSVQCNLVEQPSLLAQWGIRAAIPKAGKDWAYSVTLYEATGAVKSIKLSSKAALDKATVDAAFGIANTLLDARETAETEAQKKADAAAAAADELAVLTRARQILDERAKIKKLCEELALTNCAS